MPFEPGNQLGKAGRRDKPWREAINRAVKRRGEGDLQALDRCADALVAAAIEGDLQAMKEIGDRLDGKPPQQQIINGDEDGGPVKFEKIERTIVHPQNPNSGGV